MATTRATAPQAPGATVLPEAPGLRRAVRRLTDGHPWVTHVVVVGTVLLLGLVTAFSAWSTVQGIMDLGMFPRDSDHSLVMPAVWAAGTVVGATLLLARRAHPVAVVATLTGLGVLSVVTTGVVGVLGTCAAIALHSVASRRSAAVTWATCLVVLTVLGFTLWNEQVLGAPEILLWGDVMLPDDWDPARNLTEPPFSSGRRSFSVTILVVMLLLAVATGSGARARRIHALNLVERYEAVTRDRDASVTIARVSERTLIAREMHDIVAHNVSVMIALSDGAAAALDRSPDRSREALRELSSTGRAALADMQRVLGALDPGTDGARPRTLEPAEPTETDLTAIVSRFRAAGVPLTATGLDVGLPPDTTLHLALVRIVSEALTNVLRHAPGASTVEVHVRRDATSIEIDVLDGGPAPTAPAGPGAGHGSGRGILGMRERAALLGGRVDAGPRPDGGWRVHVVLPCSEVTT